MYQILASLLVYTVQFLVSLCTVHTIRFSSEINIIVTVLIVYRLWINWIISVACFVSEDTCLVDNTTPVRPILNLDETNGLGAMPSNLAQTDYWALCLHMLCKYFTGQQKLNIDDDEEDDKIFLIFKPFNTSHYNTNKSYCQHFHPKHSVSL